MRFVDYSMRDQFGSQFPDVPLIGCTGTEADMQALVPKVDENYYFNRDALGDVLNHLQDVWSGQTREPMMVMGPTGSGKTSLIQQVCARLNAPVIEVTGHGRLEVPQLLYSKVASSGSTLTLNGPLTQAMSEGVVFVFNEIDLVEPDTLTGLNDILEYHRVVIEDDGRLIEAQPGFAFFATANTGGGGDETGLYGGTKVMNLAFRDRFRKLVVDYPDTKAEEQLLSTVFPKLDVTLRDRFIEVASLVRGAFNDPAASMEVTMSTRTLIRWIRLTESFNGQTQKGRSPVHYALDRALAFGTGKGVYDALHQMVEQVFGVPAMINTSTP